MPVLAEIALSPVGLSAAFAAGVISFVSPCVWPLVPAYLSMITGLDITAGLPSDFGYALASDPGDADSVLVIPENNSQFRATVDGRIRVFRSRDAGRSWHDTSDGLPQQNAYVTILRDGLDSDGLAPCGFYFGTSSGHLFASVDGGDHWRLLCGFLPGILSVAACTTGGTP